MHKRKFFIQLMDIAAEPIEPGLTVSAFIEPGLTVSAFTIDHALQVCNAWIAGTGKDLLVYEIRAEAKRGLEYTESL